MPLEPLPIGLQDDTYERGGAFFVMPEHRRKHMAIFGATGAGKSTLLRNMIACDIASGVGVTVVDPHGQLVDELLDNHIPRFRTNDVIYFNPKDRDRVLSINVLEAARPEQRELVVSNVIGIFHKLWEASWGPRLEDILRNGLFALIEQPAPVSLIALPKMLTNTGYRTKILANVSNPIVLDFFRNNYDKWKDAFREEATSPVLNKLRAFLTNPLLRGILGQTRSSFDFRWMIDNHKILLCDLSKGAIGEDNARLLGSLIVMKEKLAALSRQDIAEDVRRIHVLYTEEAQNFIGDFPSILSEARKYKLLLVLVTQGIEQLSKEAALAVFTNCATLVSFRVSGSDAERLKHEFAMVFPASGLQDMPDYKVYVRTLKTDEHGTTRPAGPHLVKSYPPAKKMASDADRINVLRTSLQRYTRTRKVVDEGIVKFLLN
jgi:hypothetical protein